MAVIVSGSEMLTAMPAAWRAGRVSVRAVLKAVSVGAKSVVLGPLMACRAIGQHSMISIQPV
jgi:hypothetical protein